MAPILADLKREYAGRADIVFIDVWENPDAGDSYRIRGISTQVFFDPQGREVWRHEGFLDRPEIVARLRSMGVE
jgi:thioredoxin 1